MPLRGPTCKMVLAGIQFRLNSKLDPSVAKKGCFIYKVHYNQNDQLELMISTHKSVLKIGIGSQFIRQNAKQLENLVFRKLVRGSKILK